MCVRINNDTYTRALLETYLRYPSLFHKQNDALQISLVHIKEQKIVINQNKKTDLVAISRWAT